MKRSAIREAAFKLIYSFEIQEPENLEEQIDLYLECEEITDKEAKEYIVDAINTVITIKIGISEIYLTKSIPKSPFLRFHCTIHPPMWQMIKVKDADKNICVFFC